MAVPPKRFASLSQFWLPSLLFVLSVVSILFTLRNDDIPVIGPTTERPLLDTSDLDSHRHEIEQALQGSSSWQIWCEKQQDAVASVRVAHFDQNPEDARWTDLRRHMPQREQDALLRCQNAVRTVGGPMHACLFLTANDKKKSPGLHLVELTLELRAQGRKKVYSCAEALKSDQPVELAAWYTYSWTSNANKKPLRFERLTGGTRIFPPLAQNAERSTASSQP
ncbi:MAG TPA: hypothetical protein VE954_09335 [Oligoflexus sp.]|uniref:hypothetical protein n=1 Tax=Oligoflexus sp. TaxID=1971216 RepID=UPI002D55BD3F|nr:hypothetical protein [Oligoflexus sp.]HYX33304.1 hypothetical protein [Oligoflexus sp.]